MAYDYSIVSVISLALERKARRETGRFRLASESAERRGRFEAA